uniref:Glycoside hydrolase family 28 n=1 Tax=Aretaon asperrimus TaxID=173775 RepID=A0A191XSX3_9NEOP|nr:glycoside hydrolase family 28 [Aretaon asperrimus]
MGRTYPLCFWALFTIAAFAHVATARDLRNVTEPKTPPVCTSLKATSEDDTELIQKALDACAKGKAVALSSGTFYSGPLTIPSGVSLLVDSGVTLKAIPTPKLYDLGGNTCGTVDKSGFGCKPFITIKGATSSGIYGKGTIDGQGGEKMTGTNTTWWKLSRMALNWGLFQNNPRLIQINNSVDITVYQITLTSSPFYHLTTSEVYGFTVWGIFINSSHATRNTDGIDPTGSQNVTIAHCNISTVDDNIAITAMTAPARHISVFNNHLSHGNGMAIGSGIKYGVSDVTFSGITLNSLTYAIYIKSHRASDGLVTNISYDNICISRSRYPICLDMFFDIFVSDRETDYQNISFNNINVATNGTFVFHGISDSNPIRVNMNNVHISKHSEWSVSHANITGAWKDDSVRRCGFYGND